MAWRGVSAGVLSQRQGAHASSVPGALRARAGRQRVLRPDQPVRAVLRESVRQPDAVPLAPRPTQLPHARPQRQRRTAGTHTSYRPPPIATRIILYPREAYRTTA